MSNEGGRRPLGQILKARGVVKESQIQQALADTGAATAPSIDGTTLTRHPFHPDAAQRTLDLPEGLFGLERVATDGSQRILALFNFTSRPQSLARQQFPADLPAWKELIGETQPAFSAQELVLPAYAACWFSDTH